MSVTAENFMVARYQTPDRLAFVSFGADSSTNDDQPQWLYSVTITDHDYKEFFQEDFVELENALDQLNKKYRHWDLIIAGEKKSGDGCSSCHAH
jgi:hypothetical protein